MKASTTPNNKKATSRPAKPNLNRNVNHTKRDMPPKGMMGRKDPGYGRGC